MTGRYFIDDFLFPDGKYSRFQLVTKLSFQVSYQLSFAVSDIIGLQSHFPTISTRHISKKSSSLLNYQALVIFTGTLMMTSLTPDSFRSSAQR
jgi:hypothetical protein